MMGIRLIAALVFVGMATGCGGGPFHRPVTDNRAPDRVRIDAVADDGTIHLADGRRVRLDGIRTPDDSAERAEFLQRLRQHVGADAQIEIADVAAPVPQPAEVLVWEPVGYCGLSTGTWDPDPNPLAGWSLHPLARNLAADYGE